MTVSRLTVSLPPERAALIRAFAKAQGVPVSQVFNEIVESIEPSLTRVLALLQAAESASQDVRSNLASAVHSVELSIINAAAVADSSVDFLLRHFEEHAGNATGPRIVTRGSHSPDVNDFNKLQKATNSTAKRRKGHKNA